MEKVAEDYNTVHNSVLDKFLRRFKTLDGSDMTEDILGQFLFDYIHNIGNQTADTNIKKIMIDSAKRMRSLKADTENINLFFSDVAIEFELKTK